MLLLKLSDAQSRMFDEPPEADMGVHFARVQEELGFILSGRVLMFPNTKREEGRAASEALAKRYWFGEKVLRFRQESPRPTRITEQEIGEENGLIGALYPAPDDLHYVRPTDPFVMGFILNPPGYLPPAPARPAHIFGHLPFTGATQAGDVFYRCEHWATSRRVKVGTKDVLGGTYGFPASELGFVPTGFAAVGRYALPDLPPACRRYEITPPPNYMLQCGACVPLYGQAGGGVEVMFPKRFVNEVTLPAPVVLPPL